MSTRDASKWPVKTTSGREHDDLFSHYMSLKDLIHQCCEMEHPHIHEKVFQDEKYVLGNYHLIRFFQECVNWLIYLSTQHAPNTRVSRRSTYTKHNDFSVTIYLMCTMLSGDFWSALHDLPCSSKCPMPPSLVATNR